MRPPYLEITHPRAGHQHKQYGGSLEDQWEPYSLYNGCIYIRGDTRNIQHGGGALGWHVRITQLKCTRDNGVIFIQCVLLGFVYFLLFRQLSPKVRDIWRTEYWTP